MARIKKTPTNAKELHRKKSNRLKAKMDSIKLKSEATKLKETLKPISGTNYHCTSPIKIKRVTIFKKVPRQSHNKIMENKEKMEEKDPTDEVNYV